MLSQEIRKNFLSYFKKQGHTIVPSSLVVPHEDPTLLFVNAGMNQFKDVFLGKSSRDFKRAASSQKCIRVGGKHNDLDNVGHTSRHMTFFEMLGNFSFGDYFKEDAIKFAWDITLNVFNYPQEKIWATIFNDDDEAFELWKKYLPETRIVRFGEKENFWAMGDLGPCGPCSELLFDRGEAYGSATHPHQDISGERFLEFWNLVFMQFNRDISGGFKDLPSKSIDTGAGLERVVMLKMGVNSVFETDILKELIHEIEKLSGKKYDPQDGHLAPAFHVIADHLRSLSFAIADGAQPSNIERGYVLRKILRRAVRYGRLLDFQNPFLGKGFVALMRLMGNDFPELKSASHRIEEILLSEEETFNRTLKRGGNILNTVIEKAKQNPHKQISGEDAFKLKDTYGFPLEEVLLIAKDLELSVNLDAYELLQERAKELSKSARQIQSETTQANLFKDYVSKHGPCTFIGYEEDICEATIMAIVKDGDFVDKLEEGQEGAILLNRTPFYAEKGGQLGDTGEIFHHKAHFHVSDCKSPYPDVIIHIGLLKKGTLIGGEPVKAHIDKERRKNIANHHTATHLLHFALEQILGGHIKQSGSLVDTDRLRFDFTHHKPMTLDEVRSVERLVNEKIRRDFSVNTYTLSYEKAQTHPDIKQFFGEKYGSEVRVVDIDGFSKELCGGTHVSHLGIIGLFRITKEMSIAAGIRRIEASVGKVAEDFMYKKEDELKHLGTLLQVDPEKLTDKLSHLLEESKFLKAQMKAMRTSYLKELAGHLMQKVIKINDIAVLTAVVDINPDELTSLGNDLLHRIRSGILMLALSLEDRCQLLLKISSDFIAKGFDASKTIKELAPIIEGTGGGKKESAQAGGKNPDKILEAFDKLHQMIQKMC